MRIGSFIVAVLVSAIFLTSAYMIYVPYFNPYGITVENQTCLSKEDVSEINKSMETIKNKITTVSQITMGNQFLTSVFVAGDVANVLVKVANIGMKSITSMFSTVFTDVFYLPPELQAYVTTLLLVIVVFALVKFVLR